MYDMSKLFDAEAVAKAFNMESMVKAQKEGLEAVRKANSAVAEGMNTVASRQFEMVQTAMEEGIEAMRDLATAKGVEDYLAKQTAFVRQSLEKASENAKELADLATRTQKEVTEILSKQWSEQTKKAAAPTVVKK